MHPLISRTGLALATLVSLGLAAPAAHAQTPTTPTLFNFTTLTSGFVPGGLVVSRVSDGTAVTVAPSSGSSASVFLDEYSTAGTYLGTFALPSTGTNAFSLSNSATSEGALTLSANSAATAQVLTLAGYNAPSGTAGIAASKTTGNTGGTVNRTVDVINSSGVSTFVSQGPTFFSGNNVRSAVSTDGAGTTIYANGANTGIVSSNETNAGTTLVSATNTNERVLNIFSGDLYYSTGSGGGTGVGIYKVGSGLPTSTGTTGVQVVNTSSSPYDFYFANANTVYVADSVLGLQKYTSATGAAGSFTLAYSVAALGLTGLTAATTAGVTTLYGVADSATNASATIAAASNNNTLFSFSDTGAALTSTPLVTLNTAGNGSNNYAFRGVEFAPSAGSVSSAAPEPAQVAGLGFFVAGLGALILKARKKTAAQAA